MSEPRFARFVQRWAALVDAEHDAQLRADGVDVPATDHAAAEQAERRELFLSRYRSDGMWALAGTLDTETGLARSLALESLREAIRSQDGERDLPELRHDALAALPGGELSAGLPVHKGVRPHVMVVVGAAGGGGHDDAGGAGWGSGAVRGGAVNVRANGGAAIGPASGPPDLAGPADAELLDRTDGGSGTLWPTGLARQRVTCDATLQTLTVEEVPLRLGRSARLVSPALRRVIDLRDRHCVFAECAAPAIWCQAHHLTHWEDGGTTDERNLALLCGHHHRAIHERGFHLRWTPDGREIQTLRPDHTRIDVPAVRPGTPANPAPSPPPHPIRR